MINNLCQTTGHTACRLKQIEILHVGLFNIILLSANAFTMLSHFEFGHRTIKRHNQLTVMQG